MERFPICCLAVIFVAFATCTESADNKSKYNVPSNRGPPPYRRVEQAPNTSSRKHNSKGAAESSNPPGEPYGILPTVNIAQLARCSIIDPVDWNKKLMELLFKRNWVHKITKRGKPIEGISSKENTCTIFSYTKRCGAIYFKPVLWPFPSLVSYSYNKYTSNVLCYHAAFPRLLRQKAIIKSHPLSMSVALENKEDTVANANPEHAFKPHLKLLSSIPFIISYVHKNGKFMVFRSCLDDETTWVTVHDSIAKNEQALEILDKEILRVLYKKYKLTTQDLITPPKAFPEAFDWIVPRDPEVPLDVLIRDMEFTRRLHLGDVDRPAPET